MDEDVWARTCFRLRPLLVIRMRPQIFGYQGVQEPDLVVIDLVHQPKAVQGAWRAGRLVEQRVAVLVSESSRVQMT